MCLKSAQIGSIHKLGTPELEFSTLFLSSKLKAPEIEIWNLAILLPRQ
jgi:hypothetical protein